MEMDAAGPAGSGVYPQVNAGIPCRVSWRADVCTCKCMHITASASTLHQTLHPSAKL